MNSPPLSASSSVSLILLPIHDPAPTASAVTRPRPSRRPASRLVTLKAGAAARPPPMWWRCLHGSQSLFVSSPTASVALPWASIRNVAPMPSPSEIRVTARRQPGRHQRERCEGVPEGGHAPPSPCRQSWTPRTSDQGHGGERPTHLTCGARLGDWAVSCSEQTASVRSSTLSLCAGSARSPGEQCPRARDPQIRGPAQPLQQADEAIRGIRQLVHLPAPQGQALPS